MPDQLARTRRLLGDAAMAALARARVAVFGLGGVGGYACEALCRSGVGTIDLVDSDRVSPTNLNRQIVATQQTLGQYKTEAMRARILSIDPRVQVNVWTCFFLPENAGQFPFASYDYVVDAMDTVTAKLALAERCRACGTPLISCMGTGNKLDPTALRVADIYATRMDPLARILRRELKKRGIGALKVVYSEEEPLPVNAAAPEGDDAVHPARRAVPGSTAFVPAAAGLILAGEVVRDLTSACRAPAAR